MIRCVYEILLWNVNCDIISGMNHTIMPHLPVPKKYPEEQKSVLFNYPIKIASFKLVAHSKRSILGI